MNDYHKSVLLDEVIKYLQIKSGNWYLDCTLGDGGYSLEIVNYGGKVIGVDQDPESIKRAMSRFEAQQIDPSNYVFLNGNFVNIIPTIDHLVSGIVFDLGVSSNQFDTPQRGFSFQNEAILDMRMDPNLGVSAKDLINGLGKNELIKLFEKYGEQTDRRIVTAIIEHRKSKPIETTTELARIVEQAVGHRRSGQIHPATTVFQALRIAVNDEINALQSSLDHLLDKLELGGRIVVVSFHSLEDRIVKLAFKQWQDQNFGTIITDKPLTPSETEVEQNPRSRSAKMRVFEKGKIKNEK